MENKGDIVRQYLSDGRAWMPTMSLTRLIYADNKSIWSDFEACRATVRRVRGNIGNKNRIGELDKSNFRESGNSNDFYYPIPEPIKQIVDWKIFKIQNAKNVLLLPDMQIPYHDPKVIECAVKYGKDNGADTIIFNSETLD